jgi:hypothetical protein
MAAVKAAQEAPPEPMSPVVEEKERVATPKGKEKADTPKAAAEKKVSLRALHLCDGAIKVNLRDKTDR